MDAQIRIEKDITLTLGAAGSGTETQRVMRVGRDFQCISVTTDGVVQIGIDQDATTGRYLRKGMGGTLKAGTPDYTFLEFTNTALTSQTLVVQTSMGDIRDSRWNPTGGYVSVNDLGADGITDTADTPIAAGGTLTIAASATRKGVLVYNLDVSTTLRWGAAPAAAQGQPIPPSSQVLLPVTCQVKIFNPGASPVTVCLVELTKA